MRGHDRLRRLRQRQRPHTVHRVDRNRVPVLTQPFSPFTFSLLFIHLRRIVPSSFFSVQLIVQQFGRQTISLSLSRATVVALFALGVCLPASAAHALFPAHVFLSCQFLL